MGIVIALPFLLLFYFSYKSLNSIYVWLGKNRIRSYIAIFGGALFIALFSTIYWYEYSNSFIEGVLVELHGLVFEIAILLVVLYYIDNSHLKRKRKSEIIEQIEGLKHWDSSESSYKITYLIKELLQLSKNDRFEFIGLKINNMDFGSIDFHFITFTKCVFEKVKFNESQFNHVHFQSCTFKKSYFIGSEFINTKFYNCNFIKCNFVMANLVYSSLFEDAINISNCKFSNEDLIKKNDLSNTNKICKKIHKIEKFINLREPIKYDKKYWVKKTKIEIHDFDHDFIVFMGLLNDIDNYFNININLIYSEHLNIFNIEKENDNESGFINLLMFYIFILENENDKSK